MIIKTIATLSMSILFSTAVYAVPISQNELLGTWHVKNQTADDIYDGTRGKVTFNEDGTVIIDKGAFAAAGIVSNNKHGTCSMHNGPIRYQKIGNGEFYLHWKSKKVEQNSYGGRYLKRYDRFEKLDAVIEVVKKKVNNEEGRVRLTFIGSGGCATNPSVVKVSYLDKKIDTPQEPELACRALIAEDENACKEDFFHVGEDQSTEVPVGANYMRVKIWGAGGNRDNGARGGVGGFSTAVIPVIAGDNYSIVVGRWGNNGGTENYGFGGSGGGLSGIFTGTETVLSSDQARAVIVAGGGGASSDGDFGIRNGQDGNNPANLIVATDMAAACRVGRGGGGGGFEGGQSSGGACNNNNRTAFGYGGSGFIAPDADTLSASIETGFANCETGVRVPANYLDADWQRVMESTCVGPGTEESFSDRGAAVLIEWFDELP